MAVISETVDTYCFGAIKVIRKTEEDKQGYLIQTKKVFVAGIKVFQSSTCRKRSIRDSVIQVWGGEMK